MAKAILLISVCTLVVDVIENIASEQVSNRIDKRKVNNISTSDLFGGWRGALHLCLHSGYEQCSALCFGDVSLFLDKPMEKCKDIVVQSTMGTRIVAQLQKAKASHVQVSKFDILFSCWWTLFLVCARCCRCILNVCA
jgi:hypothetical protein